MLGNNTFDQLTDNDLFKSFNQSNSIANVVKHLWGNMMSRWTDVLTSDGEKKWRNRESEFESTIETREELLIKWEEGWSCLFLALKSIHAENFESIIYIRNQGHTITEAINRQLAHYSYHIGQIVLLGTIIKGNDWNSLSIPKGKSLEYNEDKFAKAKSRQHFTDDLLE